MSQVVSFYILAFLAVLFYVWCNFISKKLIHIPPFMFMGVAMFFLSLFSFIAYYFFSPTIKVPSNIDIIYLILFWFLNFIWFALFLYVIRTIPISHYLIIGTLNPIITWIIAYSIWLEKLNWNFFIGSALVFFWIFLALYN